MADDDPKLSTVIKSMTELLKEGEGYGFEDVVFTPYETERGTGIMCHYHFSEVTPKAIDVIKTYANIIRTMSYPGQILVNVVCGDSNVTMSCNTIITKTIIEDGLSEHSYVIATLRKKLSEIRHSNMKYSYEFDRLCGITAMNYYFELKRSCFVPSEEYITKLINSHVDKLRLYDIRVSVEVQLKRHTRVWCVKCIFNNL